MELFNVIQSFYCDSSTGNLNPYVKIITYKKNHEILSNENENKEVHLGVDLLAKLFAVCKYFSR